MPARIPYHHPFDKDYSLDYVNPDKANVEEQIEGDSPETQTKI